MAKSTEIPILNGASGMPVRALLQNVWLAESRLAARIRDVTWRVPGSPLESIKRLFTEQGRQIDRWVGVLSDRIRAIGVAVASVTSPVPAGDGREQAAAPRAAVSELLARHEAMMNELRVIVDAVYAREPEGDTALLLGSLLEFHETSAWMLRLLLETPEQARVI